LYLTLDLTARVSGGMSQQDVPDYDHILYWLLLPVECALISAA
jgi:hypothetical protein